MYGGWGGRGRSNGCVEGGEGGRGRSNECVEGGEGEEGVMSAWRVGRERKE